MEQIASGGALGAGYKIYRLSGTVTGADTRSETEVSGSVGAGTQFSSAIRNNISSETTNFQTIFVETEDGKQRPVKFRDFILPCKEGHEVSLFSLKPDPGENGFFTSVNHTTGETYQHHKVLSSALFPTLFYLVVLVGSFGLLALNLVADLRADGQDPNFGLMLFLGVLFLIWAFVLRYPFKLLAALRARSVRKNQMYRAGLASE